MKKAFLLSNGLSEENYCTLRASQIRIPKEKTFYAACQKKRLGAICPRSLGKRHFLILRQENLGRKEIACFKDVLETIDRIAHSGQIVTE